jgi:chorismate mutase / prephenate dehydratase
MGPEPAGPKIGGRGKMTTQEDILSGLRGQIDGIDDALHDLILQRAALVARIRDAKDGSDPVFFRPGREVLILRRLLSRHEGILPPGVIVRMWREMITAFVSLQGPFSVAVSNGEDGGYWDIARDHFGSGASMKRHATPRGVVQAVADGSATVGVVSVPHAGEEQPWWPLFGLGAARVRICARLPFLAGGNSRGGALGALVLATGPLEETGDDRSFIMIECAEALSRSRLTGAVVKSGFKHHMFVEAGGAAAIDGRVRYLVEVEGFVADDHSLLTTLVEGEELVESARVVGAYAIPPGIRWDGSAARGGR